MNLLAIAGWIAPSATMIAAILTASNLGARVTGWGFVIFTIGASAWCGVAAATGQNNLLWSNAFLLIVDGIGIYRWLGRQARLEDGAQVAVERSRSKDRPLFPLHTMENEPLLDEEGREIGRLSGAMGVCETGRIAYVVVAHSDGIGKADQYRAVAWKDIACCAPFRSRLTRAQLESLPTINPSQWPAKVTDVTTS
jgi:hypothetical protein